MTQHALLGNVGRYDHVFVRGEGMRLYDDSGKEYLDFLAGIAVCALGHSHPAVTRAIQDQAATLLHVSNLFHTPQNDEASLAIASRIGPGKVYFCNSGTEANEAAIKLARKRAWRNDEPGRVEIVSLEGSFHGRTMGSLAATGSPAKWQGFQPLPGGFVSIPRDDVVALDRVVGDRTAAVLIEAVQGEGGVWPLDASFVDAARKLTTDRGALLVVDEIQTGVGRTGRWWGYEHYGIRPDVVTLAKALGNGFPVGAMWVDEAYADALRPGDHSTTQGGNPLASAAVLATLSTIESEGLVDRSARMGEVLREAVAPLGESVRGLGLLVALELGKPIANAVVRAAHERGLIVNDVVPTAVRLAPPLIVTEDDIASAASILKDAIGAADA